MEKTAREWLMELKPEHRDLAIENVKILNNCPECVFDYDCKSLHKSLVLAFNWDISLQGHKFWTDIFNQIRTNTYYDEEAKS